MKKIVAIFFLVLIFTANLIAEVSEKEFNNLKEDFEMQKALLENLFSKSEKKLIDFYGYIDVQYNRYFDKKNLDAGGGDHFTPNKFNLSSLNLYCGKELTDKFKFLSEFKFNLPDSRDEKKSVDIVRAWIEYRYNQLINFRFGKYLIPYGIWNVDHGAPVITTVKVPDIINSDGISIFPSDMTGIQFYGSFLLSELIKMNYKAYIGNGFRSSEAVEDSDKYKPYGGYISFEFPYVKLGASYLGYKDSFSEQSDTPGVPGLSNKVDGKAWGFDLTFELKKFKLTGEYIKRDNAYANTNASTDEDNELFRSMGAFKSTKNSVNGWYIQAEYELLTNLKPYAVYEKTDFTKESSIDFDGYSTITLGVNYKIKSNIIFKNEVAITKMEKMRSFNGTTTNPQAKIFNSSLTIAF